MDDDGRASYFRRKGMQHGLAYALTVLAQEQAMPVTLPPVRGLFGHRRDARAARDASLRRVRDAIAAELNRVQVLGPLLGDPPRERLGAVPGDAPGSIP